MDYPKSSLNSVYKYYRKYYLNEKKKSYYCIEKAFKGICNKNPLLVLTIEKLKKS